MIKLIACDIDGTLIPYGEHALPQELFPLVHALREQGILFCPASGRQYHSLRALFAPIADSSCFLCENGAAIFGPSETEENAPLLSATPFPRKEAMELCRDIMACPNGDIFISGINTTYICKPDDKLIYQLESVLGNRYAVIDDPEDIQDDILKISVHCPDGVVSLFDRLAHWGKVFRMAEAGPIWIDFTLSDKGTGIKALCEALRIPLSEVAAFGDNWNDLAMLQAVGHPYLMSAADPKLRALLPQQCENPLTVMREILEGRIS